MTRVQVEYVHIALSTSGKLPDYCLSAESLVGPVLRIRYHEIGSYPRLSSGGISCLISKPNSRPPRQEVQKLPKRPDDKTLLTLYAFYKQATLEDVTGARPSGFDMVGKAKYDAWAKLKGTSQEMAMQAYIEVVRRLKG